MVLEVHSCQWSPGAENFWIPAISRMDICVSHQKLSGLWISASLTRNSTNFSSSAAPGSAAPGLEVAGDTQWRASPAPPIFHSV